VKNDKVKKTCDTALYQINYQFVVACNNCGCPVNCVSTHHEVEEIRLICGCGNKFSISYNIDEIFVKYKYII